MNKGCRLTLGVEKDGVLEIERRMAQQLEE